MAFALEAPSRRLEDEREQQLRKADTAIAALLKDGPMLYEAVLPRVLELPLVWSSDLNEVLMRGYKSGRFLIEGLGPRERTPKPGHKIRLAR